MLWTRIEQLDERRFGPRRCAQSPTGRAPHAIEEATDKRNKLLHSFWRWKLTDAFRTIPRSWRVLLMSLWRSEGMKVPL